MIDLLLRAARKPDKFLTLVHGISRCENETKQTHAATQTTQSQRKSR